MPWANPEANAEFVQPQARGPIMLTNPILATQPGSIPSAGNWTSGILSGDGYTKIAIGATSTQTGEISVQRYLDQAGLVVQGAPSTVALTANQPANVNVTDGLPYGSFSITITNTGGAAATISNFAALLAAA